jgi:hypothetical protein
MKLLTVSGLFASVLAQNDQRTVGEITDLPRRAGFISQGANSSVDAAFFTLKGIPSWRIIAARPSKSMTTLPDKNQTLSNRLSAFLEKNSFFSSRVGLYSLVERAPNGTIGTRILFSDLSLAKWSDVTITNLTSQSWKVTTLYDRLSTDASSLRLSLSLYYAMNPTETATGKYGPFRWMSELQILNFPSTFQNSNISITKLFWVKKKFNSLRKGAKGIVVTSGSFNVSSSRPSEMSDVEVASVDSSVASGTDDTSAESVSKDETGYNVTLSLNNPTAALISTELDVDDRTVTGNLDAPSTTSSQGFAMKPMILMTALLSLFLL